MFYPRLTQINMDVTSGCGARPVKLMIMNDTCAIRRSRVPPRSSGRIKGGVTTVKDERGLYFVFCVRQSSLRGCHFSFVFVYFVK